MTRDTADKINKDIEYLFSKIDWGESFLDARAVDIMNNLRKRIDRLNK
jgi:hypothetical protein